MKLSINIIHMEPVIEYDGKWHSKIYIRVKRQRTDWVAKLTLVSEPPQSNK